jgi:hypothetical protein
MTSNDFTGSDFGHPAVQGAVCKPTSVCIGLRWCVGWDAMVPISATGLCQIKGIKGCDTDNGKTNIRRMSLIEKLALFEQHTLFDWQKKLIEWAKLFDTQTIHIILLDEIGFSDKHIFAEWMEYHNIGFKIPPFNTVKGLMKCCMCIPAQLCYLIDMPRAMKKDKLAGFYAGIECLKDGVMYEFKKKAFKKKRISCPNIFIFTNTIPDVEFLSIHRWKIHRITNHNDFIEVDVQHIRTQQKMKKKMKKRIC